MFCSNCGFKLQELSKFCSSCGKTVSAIPDKNMQDSKGFNDSINSLREGPIENLGIDPIPNPKTSLSEPNINYSGFWRRFAAMLIDSLIFYIPGLIYIYFIDIETYSNPLFYIIGFLISLGYQLYFLKRYNATPGKIFIGLRIIPINSTNQHLDTKTIILRQIGFILSYLVFLLGFLMQPFNKKKRAMHDFIAKTIVIDEKKRLSWQIFTIIIVCIITLNIFNLKIAPLINPKLFIDIQNATNQTLYEKNDSSNLPDPSISESLPTRNEAPMDTSPRNKSQKEVAKSTTKDFTKSKTPVTINLEDDWNASNIKLNWFEIEKEITTNIPGSTSTITVKIAVGTPYHDGIFDNIMKHEENVHLSVKKILRTILISEIEKPKFRKELSIRIKDAINITLEDLEDFGGIQEVIFTSFEIN